MRFLPPVASRWLVWLWATGAAVVFLIALAQLSVQHYGDALHNATWALAATFLACEMQARRYEHGLVKR